jgi:hypothetical protein
LGGLVVGWSARYRRRKTVRRLLSVALALFVVAVARGHVKNRGGETTPGPVVVVVVVCVGGHR